jgi:4-hydroxy-2-oxoheptanedioate aldolase
VVASLPSNCRTRDEVVYNAWQTRHVLTAGAHGVNHTHARDPEAVRAYVSTARYPFQTIGRDLGLPEGMRGGGGQEQPAAIWGISPDEYLRKADPWPLNPDGELLLGLKIEDRHALPNADAIAATPGIYFAEWGPGDMSFSHGDPAMRTVPLPPVLERAMNTVVSACHKAGIAFHGGWSDPSMSDEERAKYVIEELGARIVGTADRGIADAGRRLTGRTMPV